LEKHWDIRKEAWNEKSRPRVGKRVFSGKEEKRKKGRAEQKRMVMEGNASRASGDEFRDDPAD